jgi:hypothetical protein
MLVTGSFLSHAVNRFNRKKRIRESFTRGDSVAAGASAALDSFILVLAAIFFLLELIALFFAVNMALVCSKSVGERIVNLVLATTFTLPYLLIRSVFSACGKAAMRPQQTAWSAPNAAY